MNRTITLFFLLLTSVAIRAQPLPPPQIAIGGNDGLSGFLYLNKRGPGITLNKEVNEADIVKLIPGETQYGKMNFFLLKKNGGVHDTTTDFNLATAKKINDSLYEIYIFNTDYELIFGHHLQTGYTVAFKGTESGGMNSPDIMGGMIDSLLIRKKEILDKYKAMPFNPFLYGAEIYIFPNAPTPGTRQLLTFRILYQFPAPLLKAVTTDTAFIHRKKENPSFIYFNARGDDRNRDTAFAKSSTAILFVFNHFAEKYRFGYPDNLMYKLDEAQDWTLTPLAHTPTILLENMAAGKHTLYVKYPAEKAAVLSYTFEIKPGWKDSPLWSILLYTFVTALLAILYFRIRLKRIKTKMQQTRLDLQAIQAQLNPHFMFNALASIQYLMHHNKESADLYLTEFGNLLRHSLYNSEKEMVPLSVELQTLNSYIGLEKLRFHFTYQQQVDEKIEIDNINIPSLLIQPLIENAIKHGISELQQDGILQLGIAQNKNDLVITITDNGKGFTEPGSSTGLGLKLVKERMAILKKQKLEITLSFQSNRKDRTTATVILKDWL